MITVKRQLTIILLATIAVVVVLLTGTFFVIEWFSYRRIAVETIYPQAETIGINLRASLSLRDIHAARNVLATLLADSTVEAVYLFDAKGNPFSFVQRQLAFSEGHAGEHPESFLDKHTIEGIVASGERDSRFVRGHLVAFMPIQQDGRKIGTVYVIANLTPLTQRLWWWLLCALPLVAMTIGVGLSLAARMQRRISVPLEQLTKTMRLVSGPEGMKVRADVRSNTVEIAALVSGFNGMLDQIALRDRELAEINATLEDRIRQRTEELHNSETKYRTLFEESPISLWEEDFSEVKASLDDLRRRGISDVGEYLRQHPDEAMACMGLVRIIDVNQRTVELFRGGSKDVIFAERRRLLAPTAVEPIIGGLVALSEGRARFAMELEGKSCDGDTIICALQWAVMPGHELSYDRIVVSIEDITDRQRMQERLQNSLHEKEILLREVHHRVKNNLQVITSLLGLQMKKNRDPAIIQALQVSLSRVRSISLIHEKLYAHESAPVVELGNYLVELASDIFQLHNIHGERVQLQVEVDPIETNLDILMALALIVNEVVTNALKYAFPGERCGTVSLVLKNDAAGLCLIIGDDGIGLPEGTNWETVSSLGLRLVGNLARQISGVVELRSEAGTQIILRCPTR